MTVVSLPGALAGGSASLPDRRPAPTGAGRAHVVRAGRSAPVGRWGRTARGFRRRQGRVLAVLLALALGAGGALGLLAVAEPAVLTAASGGIADTAGPASAEVVVPAATVIASTPCNRTGAQDVVSVPLAGGPTAVALEGCGATVGSTVDVRVLVTGHTPGGDPLATATGTEGAARLVGAGSAAPLATGEAPSSITGRITVTLTVVAGIATAGLLVSLGRQRPGRPTAGGGRGPGSARGAAESAPDDGAGTTGRANAARRTAGTDRSRPRRGPHAPHPATSRRSPGARGPAGGGQGQAGRRPARRGSRR